jgi:hypothetical protein
VGLYLLVLFFGDARPNYALHGTLKARLTASLTDLVAELFAIAVSHALDGTGV